MTALRHVRWRWPEPVPAGEPEWLFYEFDVEADAVLRTVWLFPGGTIHRNSIEIEERGGIECPSLIDTSIGDGFEGIEFEEIEQAAFDQAWAGGVDTPFWNVG